MRYEMPDERGGADEEGVRDDVEGSQGCVLQR